MFPRLLTFSGAGAALKCFDYKILTARFSGHKWRLFAKCHGKRRHHQNVRSLYNWHAACFVGGHVRMCLSEWVVFSCVYLQAREPVFHWMSSWEMCYGCQVLVCIHNEINWRCVQAESKTNFHLVSFVTDLRTHQALRSSLSSLSSLSHFTSCLFTLMKLIHKALGLVWCHLFYSMHSFSKLGRTTSDGNSSLLCW